MIRVFTDSAANLPPEMLERCGLQCLPMCYTVTGPHVGPGTLTLFFYGDKR